MKTSFSSVELAMLICATPVILMTSKDTITKKISAGIDSIMPTANYTMSNNDVLGYDSLRFAVPDMEMVHVDFTVGSILQTFWHIIVPTTLADKFKSQSYGLGAIENVYDTFKKSTWTQPVDIFDARTLDNDFNRTGFDLITDDAFPTFDWNNVDQHEVMEKLHKIMKPHISNYYPNATRILIGTPIKRNTLSIKIINSAHIDFVPNDEQREAFYKKNKFPGYQVIQCLLGNCDTEDDEFGTILGAWVPTTKTPVCDKPLAMLDASSISPEDVSVASVTIPSLQRRFEKPVQQMTGIIKHKPEHKWYYYPYQKSNEMILFHHYNRDKRNVWGNPHSGLTFSGCSNEYETRSSVELRIAVFFPKEPKVQQIAVGNA